MRGRYPRSFTRVADADPTLPPPFPQSRRRIPRFAKRMLLGSGRSESTHHQPSRRKPNPLETESPKSGSTEETRVLDASYLSGYHVLAVAYLVQNAHSLPEAPLYIGKYSEDEVMKLCRYVVGGGEPEAGPFSGSVDKLPHSPPTR